MAMESMSMDDLLLSWDLPPQVVDNFKCNSIDKSQLKFIVSNEIYLKELCPHIGHRIVLKNKLQEYIESIADTETITDQTDTTISTDKDANIVTIEDIKLENVELKDISFDIDKFFDRPLLPDFDLKTILQSTPHGNSVLNYYKNNGRLNSQKRNIIVDILVKYHYTFIINNKIKHEEYNLLAAKIVSLFPTENIGTYYVKAVPTSKSITRKYIPAKGKLVDKVRNLLYVSGHNRRISRTDLDYSSTSMIKENSTTQDDEQDEISQELSDDLLWLKNNIEPWDQVLKKWSSTHALRKKDKKNTIHEFLETWSILKYEKGDILINLDFEKLYKDKSLNFYKQFESFFSKLLNLRKHNVNNEYAQVLIDNLGNINDTDKKIPVQIFLMAYLVPPKGRQSRKVKFSTSEAIEGILIQTHDAGDIESVIRKQRDKAAARNHTVQPYVLLQGQLHNFSALYIIIDDIKYHFTVAAKAFDLLFKLYHVFHAKYPQPSEHLYLIIQKMVYNISTSYDSLPPYILDVLDL